MFELRFESTICNWGKVNLFGTCLCSYDLSLKSNNLIKSYLLIQPTQIKKQKELSPKTNSKCTVSSSCTHRQNRNKDARNEYSLTIASRLIGQQLNKQLDFIESDRISKTKPVHTELLRTTFIQLLQVDSLFLRVGHLSIHPASFGPLSYVSEEFTSCLGLPARAGWLVHKYYTYLLIIDSEIKIDRPIDRSIAVVLRQLSSCLYCSRRLTIAR